MYYQSPFMRNVSRNRFSKVVIKKSPWIDSGIVLKSNTSGIQRDQLHNVIKPTKGAVHFYDQQIIAGSAL
jgi:NAD(P)H-nitrite reductase large subunit